MPSFMLKPTSYHCNIDCDYCFYLEKAKVLSAEPLNGLDALPTNRLEAEQKNPEPTSRFQDKKLAIKVKDVSYDVSFLPPRDQKQQELTTKRQAPTFMSVQQACEFVAWRFASPEAELHFTWQGGEPLMAGREFYEQVFAYQQQLAAKTGKSYTNAIQTNGMLIDAGWIQLFKDHKVLIGISIDGDQELHNRYRVTCSGKGTFKHTKRAIDLLQKHQVEFNTLTVVNAYNVEHPIRVYRFLKSLGVRYMQFIPCVETYQVDSAYRPRWINDASFVPTVTDFSVDPLAYGKFMNAIFDEWLALDLQHISIRLFDGIMNRYAGQQHTECTYRQHCGGENLAVEANGDLYQCDHFVYPDEFYLGKATSLSLEEILAGSASLNQRKAPSAYCQSCDFLELCHGGCPKHRFTKTAAGEPLSYFCPGYKTFFAHAVPGFNLLNEFLQRQIPLSYLPQALGQVYPDFRLAPGWEQVQRTSKLLRDEPLNS